jgi:hypothetical protein
MQAEQARWATAVPATGAIRTSAFDSCLRDNGNTTASIAADWDSPTSTAKASNAFAVGYTDTNFAIQSQTDTTNTDGSTRSIVRVTSDRTFTDGTSQPGRTTTLIYGSSAGACATPTNANALRFWGNQRIAQFDMQARNVRQTNLVLATGAVNATTPEQTRREIRFNVRDPANIATYAIITGPGPAGPSGQPFSFKMLSPRVARDAPEMAGKAGNANYLDTDSFRYCNSGVAGVPTADIANCTTSGVNGDNWGFNMTTLVLDGPAQASADASFQAQGWSTAANAYTVAFYNDDGWKTVNGQVGKTPIATYTTSLPRLPYSFASMYSATTLGYGDFNADPAVYATTAAAALDLVTKLKGPGGPLPLAGLLCRTPAAGAPTAINLTTAFNQGANQTTASWPRTRQVNLQFILNSASSHTVNLPGLVSPMTSVLSGEVGLECSDRRGGVIIERVSAQ